MATDHDVVNEQGDRGPNGDTNAKVSALTYFYRVWQQLLHFF